MKDTVHKELSTYLKLCTQYYDLEKHPYDAPALVFYMEQAQKIGGAILEPMCGTGRFLIPMLQSGLDIEGFDASPFMLEALHEKAPHARAWLAFAQDFQPKKLYNLIFIPYGSWGLIVDQEQAIAALKILYESLQHGGKFIIDIDTIFSIPSSQGSWHRAINKRSDGSYIALNTCAYYDQTTQVFSCKCVYESMRDEKIELIEHEDFKQYLYRFDEFDAILRSVGFSKIKKYQDHQYTIATSIQAPLLIYECTK